jgi:uncharacterized protein GlcG (DUF336 family)
MRVCLSLVSLFVAPLVIALPAAAQQGPPGAGPPRGPSPELARQAAEAAVKTCERMGYKTMATVVDTTGQPVVAMTADPQLNKDLAPQSVRRARVAATFHTASSDIAERARLEAGVYYMIQGDPRLRPAMPGGVPFGPAGAIGVAGGPDDLKDEACARAGVKAVAAKLGRRAGGGPGATAGGPAPSEGDGKRGEGQE